MTDPGPDGRESIDGLFVREAVNVLIDRGEVHERETARQHLAPVVEDGVVSREALDEQVDEVSKVVATAETRTELAERAVADVEEAAEPVADLDTVAFHVERFESQVGNVSGWCDRLGAQLDAAIDRKDWGTIYQTTTELQEVRAFATEVQRSADALVTEIEEFESWLDSADRRSEELAGDLDALEASLTDVGDAVERLGHAVDEDGTVDPEPLAVDDVGPAWADLVLRLGVLELFVADVRAELDDLRTWAEREGDDAPVDELGEQVADLREQCEELGERLDELALREWRERFDDELAAFESELDAFDTPVDWEGVQELLEEYRSEARSA